MIRPLHFRVDALLPTLPSELTGLCTHDADLAERLRRNGTPLQSDGEVEIARSANALRSGAPTVVIVIAGETSTPRVSRILSSWRDALRALREVSRLRRRGYASVGVRQWSAGTAVASAGGTATRAKLALNGSATAVVAGRHVERSVLAAILADCSEQANRSIDARSFVSTRSGLMGIGSETVFRVGFGRTAEIVRRQIASLELLHDVVDEDDRERRTPRVLAHGRRGEAIWSLEEKLHGTRPKNGDPSAPLLADCVAFLEELYFIDRACCQAPSLEDAAAEAIALAGVGSIGPDLLELARAADSALVGIRRGFGHGDFWTGNMLARDDRLVGVVDWSDGAPNSFPFVDLYHLLVTARRTRTGESLGACVAGWLIPRMRRGDLPPVVDTYAVAVGLSPDQPVLLDFLVAYWIEQIHRQVSDFRGLIDLGRWGSTNVEPVVTALS